MFNSRCNAEEDCILDRYFYLKCHHSNQGCQYTSCLNLSLIFVYCTYIINVPHYYYFSISLRRNQTLLQHFFHVQRQKCCIPYFIRFSLFYPLDILYECIDNIPAGSSFRIQIYILLWMQLSTFMTTYIYTCSCVVWSFPIEFNTE